MLAAPFIVGADASSTALLGAALDGHPDLAIVRNTRLTREFLRAADSSSAEGLRRSYASAAARRGKQR